MVRCSMKRPWIVGALVLVVGTIIVFGLDWHFFMLTGRFTPRKIVDVLSAPVAITAVTPSGLRTVDGSALPLPVISNLVVPPSVSKDVIEHGVEISPDGTISALVRVHHWCGNDPVRFHLGRVDLSSLLLLLSDSRWSRVSDYGIDPGLFKMASIPYRELKTILDDKTSEPDGPANGSQPLRSETNPTSPAAVSRRYP
jgi:hypothetical protein